MYYGCGWSQFRSQHGEGLSSIKEEGTILIPILDEWAGKWAEVKSVLGSLSPVEKTSNLGFQCVQSDSAAATLLARIIKN